MIFKKKKVDQSKETSFLAPSSVKESKNLPLLDLDPGVGEQKSFQPATQTNFEWTSNLDMAYPAEGVDIPDVGEESLEILIDWYEKNFINPYPSKSHLNKINKLTGLSKSTIREWATIVRKNHLLVVRKEDGTRFLALNSNLSEFKLQRKRSLKDKSKKSPKKEKSQTESSGIKNMSLTDTLSEKHSDKEEKQNEGQDQDHNLEQVKRNDEKEEAKEE